MADASPSELPRRAALGAVDTWRRLNFEQRVAGVAALLLIVSTFGPFSFVEAAIVLIGVSVLFLLRRRAEGREFHIPFGDGGVIAAAGAWSALLILIRLLDRPLGQNLLALVCASLLVIAGVAERRKRPPDDLPGPEAEAHQRSADAVTWEDPPARAESRPKRRPASPPPPPPAPAEKQKPRTDSEQLALTERLEVDDPTMPLPPPEFELPRDEQPKPPPAPPSPSSDD
jgi:hypothetical protein